MKKYICFEDEYIVLVAQYFIDERTDAKLWLFTADV